MHLKKYAILYYKAVRPKCSARVFLKTNKSIFLQILSYDREYSRGCVRFKYTFIAVNFGYKFRILLVFLKKRLTVIIFWDYYCFFFNCYACNNNYKNDNNNKIKRLFNKR